MHWTLLWRGRCRVYYNIKTEFPFIWSVDDGHTDNEYKVRNVDLAIPGFHTRNGDVMDSVQPKVWLEHVGCAVYMNEQQEVKIAYR